MSEQCFQISHFIQIPVLNASAGKKESNTITLVASIDNEQIIMRI